MPSTGTKEVTLSDIPLQLVPSILNILHTDAHYHNLVDNTFVERLRDADQRLSSRRSAALKNSRSEASDRLYEEIRSTNELMSNANSALQLLSSKMERLHNKHAFKHAYQNIKHQVGLIKCDISDELRSKLLTAIHTSVLSVHKKILELNSLEKSKKAQVLKELNTLEQFIESLSGLNIELSVDDLDMVIMSLTSTIHKISEWLS